MRNPKYGEMAPPASRSEAMRLEVIAEAARRGVDRQTLAAAFGMSRTSMGYRWDGRTAWTVDEIDTLEVLFGLEPGKLMQRAVEAMYPNGRPADAMEKVAAKAAEIRSRKSTKRYLRIDAGSTSNLVSTD